MYKCVYVLTTSIYIISRDMEEGLLDIVKPYKRGL